ncbi:histidine phosphatase family protein [Kitasatospora sp. CM 4170]|uniref:SixA phosphatase family protein n=1 Tax=Kitasatospora aburaviensis TaxID=67265 RepID=A0ABW1EXQ2_9ACTN|nr:histidine phosphatase family protein [Kitasatospora sp. CM 4170]WNM43634.1 histidine phosphatase family protein [Kitasatospora sp. CM 4170]
MATGGTDMWRLIVVRHAKSAWPDVPDLRRPLAARGLRDAPAAGRWLREHGLVPDRAICSPARRAAATWELASAEWPEVPPVVHDPRVYEADADGLVDVVREVSPTVGTVLLVGHQPVLAELVLALADRDPAAPGAATRDADLDRIREKFPTSAIAVLATAEPWPQLRPGTARLTHFAVPRG